ncbi:MULTISPECIES: ferritin-like domain-containing protein [Rufibacter]|uniref:Ferritin-like metal-binding protein YciE n=1 Tax=Rufibacter quisquiliarum TaxID=1549639 RepID=A0A839GRG0_9BACT|nr:MULTISPECIES: ferritin-like domain-containing protein [Rufibacter]MBA9077467.1 ferritin-like metal-binding protein YciE [Rufibacter quisquiliarum]
MASKLSSLKDLFIHELQDLYSAEKQLEKALPLVMEKASDSKLKAAFKAHIKETEEQIQRLDKCFEILGEKAGGEKCKAMEGLIKEANSFMEEDAEASVMDAGLIACAQRVEHYEIAGYGTVCTYAKFLGETEVLNLLQETLSEEKKTDEKLTFLAESTINKKAE